ncbi:MAG: hypothetical protein ACPG8F_00390 [Flavobacteriaceae bacterium]
MKTAFNLKKSWVIFALLGSISFLQAQEYQRTINKNFSLNPEGKVSIKNSYGTVKLNSWDKDEVAIEVTITVKTKNENKAEEIFENMDIIFDATATEVSARTQLPHHNRSWWSSWSFFGTNNLNYSIDYLVQMPKSAQLAIHNSYGNIYLDETDGQAQLKCDYGRIDIGKLNHPDNSISIAYATSSEIDYINGGKIKADYSGISIEQAQEIIYDADYTKGKFGHIKTLDFRTDYGSLGVEEVETFLGQADYITLKIGQLKKALKVNMDYGSLSIDQIEASTEEVSVTADYTGIRLGAAPDWDFAFTIETDYAGFKTDFPLDYSRKELDGSDRFYKGQHGSGKNQLSLRADYGNIKLTQN